MKAIATLAVLGLAYAGERKENPRFRIDTKTLTANNNKDVLNIDFTKDVTNIPGVKSSVMTGNLKDILPGGLGDLIKDVKVDHRVFTAQNNAGVITINMDDADNELIGVTWKNKDINGSHNSGRMDININNDDADNELRTTTKVHANNNNGMMNIMGNDDELFLDFTNKHTHVNADNNSGMMNINIHNHDDELMMVPRWRNDIRRPVPTAEADDELFLDLTNKHTHVNANNNSGMMNINIHNDDADNELASWNTDNTYHFPRSQGKPDYVHIKTENTVNNFAGNIGVRNIQRDDADHELIGVTWKHKDIDGSHNSGRMDININNDDADNELSFFPKPKPWERDYIRDRNPGNYVKYDADNELRTTTKVHANNNNGMMNIMGNDDELFLDFTNKHNHINANHNSGMMNINVHNHDDELMMVPRWRNDIRRPVPTAEADDELFLDFTNKHNHINANHNSGMMNINVHNHDDELMMVSRWRNDIRRPVATAEADDELFLDFTNKHNHVNANHNSGMMNINIHNDDELMQLGALLRAINERQIN